MGKKLRSLLLLIFVLVGLCACGDDHEDDNTMETPTENNNKGDASSPDDGTTEPSTRDKDVDMYYVVVCGSDLLQFVEPEVTYTETDGTKTTVVLTADDWESYSTTQDKSEVVNYKWEKKAHFSSYGVSGQMSVRYLPLMSFSENSVTLKRSEYMYHCENIGATNKEHNRGITVSMGNKSLVGTKAVINYLEELCSTTYEKSCYVADDGTITVK